MDTMQLGLIFEEDFDPSRKDQQRIQNKIESIQSPIGNMFCDLIKFSTISDKVIIKVSFPRYFYNNNAYLVESSEKCFQVQRTLAKELRKIFGEDLKAIAVERIDIPFTYIIDKNSAFTDYNNIYKVAALIFGIKHKKSVSKSIIGTITEDRETITYADTETISAYNKKIMIYDQHLNLKTKLGKYSREFKDTIKDFPELKRRMRIEVSKRTRRIPISLKEFSEYDFFKDSSEKYKKILLKELLNSESLDNIYEKEIKKLSKTLRKYRDKKGKRFKYENFIMVEMKNIYDYKILREAIRKNLDNKKSIENGITQVRKILKELEEENGLKILEVEKEIKKIRRTIETSFRKKKAKDEELPF